MNPNAKEPPNPADPKALLFSTSIRTQAELEAKLNQLKLQALVTNSIKSLEPKIRALLQQSYPRANFDTCLIIQEGRTPSSRGLLYGTGAGAVVCLCVGLALVGSDLLKKNNPAPPVEDFPRARRRGRRRSSESED